MKKSLLALAVLGSLSLAAQAQTNITIGGIIQADLKDYSVGDTKRNTAHELRIDDDYTSRFWISGTEDLGGGNSAIFYVQNRLNTDVSSNIGDGNGLSNGDSYLGLKGAWGQATIGKHTMMDGEGSVIEYGPSGQTALPTNLFSTKSILTFVGNTGIVPTRVVNSVLYKSPVVSGLSGSIGLGTSGSNATEGTVPATGAAVGAPGDYSNGYQFFAKGNYTNGPVYLNLAYWKANIEGRPTTITAATADQSQVRVSGSYAFANGFKIGAQYDRATLSGVGRVAGVGGTDQTRTAWEIPVNYSFGASTILASYARAGDISSIANSGAKMWVLGYDYALSKRTTVGIFYSKLSNDAAGLYQHYKTGTSSNGSTLLAGESASILALSVKHSF
jgi:predicted porin